VGEAMSPRRTRYQTTVKRRCNEAPAEPPKDPQIGGELQR
jgi:hypothetical protein